MKHASGVRALLAPDNLASVPGIDPDRVARVVDQLRPHFQYIVCDLWSSLEDLTLATLRMADRVILVTTPELPALRNLRRVMSATGLLLQDDRTILVAKRTAANRASMLQDLDRHHRTEIDAITGSIVRAAGRHRIPVPLNAALYALVRGKEAAFRAVSGANVRDQTL